MEEMAEDDLDVDDVESAILRGAIVRIERDDPRGTKYVIQGLAVDEITLVGAVGRFTSTERFLIIMTYEVTEPEEKKRCTDTSVNTATEPCAHD
jgi:aspartate 1-decarboxylase